MCEPGFIPSYEEVIFIFIKADSVLLSIRLGRLMPSSSGSSVLYCEGPGTVGAGMERTEEFIGESGCPRRHLLLKLSHSAPQC